MNFRQLNQFLTVVEMRSFRKAAERLHIAQPPLSTGIRRLEEDLGARLFDRSRRGVSLTDAGLAVLADAQQIAFHVEHLRAAVEAQKTGVGGTLRVGFVGSATYQLLPKALPAFRERYPNVVLELHESTTVQILKDIENGALDLGLVRYPLIESTVLEVEPVERDVLVAALPAGHRLSRRRTLKLADLAGEPFVLYSASGAPNLQAQVMLACQTAGFAPRVVQEAVQVQTVVSLVESGMGVALVPSMSGAHSSRQVVFRKVVSEVPLDVAIAIATRPGAQTSASGKFSAVLRSMRGARGASETKR
ncbi:LysR family transcriptional regulator [Variovorax sp. OV084]|jgi:DNA-binding transcriptional LysR family regulator|uniref:LysR family transcriptional regulator n=1 Tax=Variovorax TaxID=34072 RepID=UPI0008BA7D39|nr:LysR family transcriptional regulator [Variovorax sp. OV084]SEU04193.1 DNA-binding transcriptional regulator, LysR family [Variovorax sp. OV084]